ncbi:hypothetical protein GCM10011403_07980 [Pseudohongiella nitratireducens]|jgi:hypothetical protein|uniref:Uncharacterized protein n=1 Tax=Pseudohongiella nitratireducens TaxID=1768907 RepID=A0A917GP34_9GAMM|nr:hypothetical protein GCM10011403_07980 [Pseudohongiella nitratireducens]
MSGINKSRQKAAESLKKSGVIVSKTGGAYKDPATIIQSSTAQNQLRAIAAFKKQLQPS